MIKVFIAITREEIHMEPTAIIMGIIGFALLYGGLSCCIGIAWYHSRQGKASANNNLDQNKRKDTL